MGRLDQPLQVLSAQLNRQKNCFLSHTVAQTFVSPSFPFWTKNHQMNRVFPRDKPNRAILYIFSGLPGSGKTTLSQNLCRHINAVHLRIDTIEQALRELCSIDVQGEGYRLAYRIAAENLRLSRDVIADSCNPISLTRSEWQDVAVNSEADFINIEVVCSDLEEHRQRVESRHSTVTGLVLPTWKDVTNREYHPWGTSNRIVIDTAGKTPDIALTELISSFEVYDTDA